MELKKDASGKVIVELNITKEIEIPADSKARLETADLLGGKVFELIFGDSQAFVKSGDYITGELLPDTMPTLANGVNRLINNAGSSLANLDSIIKIASPGNIEATANQINATLIILQNTLDNYNKIAVQIDSLLLNEKGGVHNILTDVESITKSVAENTDEIERTILNISEITDSLNKSVKE
jgi:phospholipid/cholesterol/gamma-HCH transport system substrate-binding protein